MIIILSNDLVFNIPKLIITKGGISPVCEFEPKRGENFVRRCRNNYGL
jgi:hypothetical protein